jgi:hypothetical protein
MNQRLEAFYEATLQLLLVGSCVTFAISAAIYVKNMAKSEPAVQTFQWEDTTYIVATGPDGSVAITAHFDPLP